MDRSNPVLLVIALGFMAGIILETQLAPSIKITLSATLICVILLTGMHLMLLLKGKHHYSFSILTLICFISLGALRSHLSDPKYQAYHYTQQQTENLRQPIYFEIAQTYRSSPYYDAYLIHLIQLQESVTRGKAILYIAKDSLCASLNIGDRYYTKTRLKKLPNKRTPYQFDYSAYLHSQDIYAQINTSFKDLHKVTNTSLGMKAYILRFRQKLSHRLQSSGFTTSQIGIIHALLLGEKKYLSKDIKEDYAAAGIIHILAVSGLHVGILVFLFRFLYAPLKRPKTRWMHSALVILSIWCYALFTGASPSVLRAATMFSFLEIGRTSHRESYGFDALIASLFFLVLIDPKLICQIGFQMSYLAVAAILWLQPWFFTLWQPKNYILRRLRDIIAVSIAAQIGVVPLSIHYFHQFPSLFLIANLIILPSLGILLSLGLCTLAIAWYQPNHILVSLYGYLIDALNLCIHWMAKQEAFLIDGLRLSTAATIGCYISIFGLLYYLQRPKPSNLLKLQSGLILLLSVLIYEKMKHPVNQFSINHIYKNSLATQYEAKRLEIFYNDSAYKRMDHPFWKDIPDKIAIDTLIWKKAPSYFRVKQKRILRLDSLGIFKIKGIQPDVIWLSYSPRIHFERLLEQYPKSIIVADGSNYAQDVLRWKTSCLKRKHPFHSTYEKGAYIINYLK